MRHNFQVKFANSDEEVQAAQALRYDVFVRECGGVASDEDHAYARERDAYDAFARHVLLIDPENLDTPVVGTYRLLDEEAACRAGGFYCASEFDLSALHAQPRRLLELGRSCLRPAYRGGIGVQGMWQFLAAYVAQEGYDLLFGVASFHGTDVKALLPSLQLLHDKHLAPESLRVQAKGPFATLPKPDKPFDKIKAMSQVPALLKAYLRLGGVIGQGAYVDHAFNTTDLCLILDMDRIDEKQKARYV